MFNSAHRRRQRGFSLIEVIFAIAMLGIGIVGVLSLFTAGLTSASKASNSSAASMEVQSLLTRILTESDGDGTKPVSHRLVLDQINVSGNPPGTNQHPWIHFETKPDGTISFANTEQPCRIDPARDLFWKCLCRPVHSDRNGDGSIAVWYPPMNPDDPFDTNYVDSSAARDATGKPVWVNGLYEIAIAVYRTQKDQVPAGAKPIQWYTTFVTAGF